MVKQYLAWQKNMGQNLTGFSAYCIRQLGQLRELDVTYGISSDINAKVCNDWSLHRWSGRGNYWHNGSVIDVDNSWEYYFQNDVNTDASNFIYSSGDYKEDCVPAVGTKNFRDKNQIEVYGKLVNRYLRPTQNVLDSLNQSINQHKTLGVHIRRSGMALHHPEAHLGWTDDMYFKKVMDTYNRYGFEKIYLATEELSVYNHFKDRAGEILLGIDDCYRVAPNQILETTLLSDSVRQLHPYYSGLEVLVDTINLSRCNSLLCFISGVTTMACFFNYGKYDEVYYFDEI